MMVVDHFIDAALFLFLAFISFVLGIIHRWIRKYQAVYDMMLSVVDRFHDMIHDPDLQRKLKTELGKKNREAEMLEKHWAEMQKNPVTDGSVTIHSDKKNKEEKAGVN